MSDPAESLSAEEALRQIVALTELDIERMRSQHGGEHRVLIAVIPEIAHRALDAARQSAPRALVTARDAHFFEAGVAEGKRLAAEEIDVGRLRKAIYAVSVRHDWANSTDTDDRTDEIAREYAALAGVPR